MKLIIQIPCYNEEKTLDVTIHDLPKRIEGVDVVRNNPNVTDFVQYYHEGDEIKENVIGTLMQHFCRVKMMTSSVEEYYGLVSMIQDTVKIIGQEGENMIYRKFDVSRLK